MAMLARARIAVARTRPLAHVAPSVHGPSRLALGLDRTCPYGSFAIVPFVLRFDLFSRAAGACSHRAAPVVAAGSRRYLSSAPWVDGQPYSELELEHDGRSGERLAAFPTLSRSERVTRRIHSSPLGGRGRCSAARHVQWYFAVAVHAKITVPTFPEINSKHAKLCSLPANSWRACSLERCSLLS